MTHRRPKRTLKLGCSDPDDATNCPAEETFWKDPLKYACGETSSCAVEDPFQGWGTANVCCPLDKPNFYVFDKKAGGSNGYFGRRLLSQQEKGSSTLTSRTRQKLGKSQGITITSRTPQKLSKPNSLRRRLSQFDGDPSAGGDMDSSMDMEGYYENCEDFCESGSLDETQCDAYDVCSWDDNQCWSEVGSESCDPYGGDDSNGDHDSLGLKSEQIGVNRSKSEFCLQFGLGTS